MRIFLSIVKIIGGIICILAAPTVLDGFFLGGVIVYALGGLLVFWGAIVILHDIIDFIKEKLFGGKGRSGGSGARYSSSNRSTGNKSDGQLMTPGADVGWIITGEITSNLYDIAPNSRLYCEVRHGDTAYLGGNICLSHRSDSGKVRGAITSGFNSAMRIAESRGFNVSGMSLQTSNVSIEIADND